MRVIICIDLGHCQTSATFIKITEDGKIHKSDRLKVEGATENITLTQLALTTEQIEKLSKMTDPTYEELKSLGAISYGKKLPNVLQSKRRFVYFKTDPAQFDIKKIGELTSRQLMASFCFALVNSILENNPNIAEKEIRQKRNQVELLVGCPATGKWTSQKPRRNYARLIQRATGVQSVRILPESTAAMFSNLLNENEKNKGTGKIVSTSEGVIVFDLGSSTIDCTYMLLGKKLIEFSWNLGASSIERLWTKKAIADATREHYNKTGEFFEVSYASRADLENLLRQHKEQYFSKIYGDYLDVDEEIVNKLSGNSNKRYIKAHINLTEETMNEILDTPFDQDDEIRWQDRRYRGSWKNLLKQFFETARELTVGADCPVKTIVITGGASRMDFVRTICAEVFVPQVKFDNIMLGSDPEFTVSDGLGWVSLSEANRPTYIENAKKKVKDNASVSVFQLRDKIINRLCNYLKNKIDPIAEQWAEAEDKKSVRNLMNRIEIALNQPGTKAAIESLIAEETRDWRKGYAEVVQKAVAEQLNKEYPEGIAKGLIPPKEIWNQINNEEIAQKISFSPERIVNSIDTQRFLKGLVGVLPRIVAFIVSGIPIIKILSKPIEKIAEFLEWIAGKLARAKDLDKPRSKPVRRSVRNQLNEIFDNDDAKEKILFPDVYQHLNELSRNYDSELFVLLDKLFRILLLDHDSFEVKIIK